MKKRAGIILLAMIMVVSMVGCSQKSGEKVSVTAEDDPQKILEEAMEKLDKENLKAAQTQSVMTYSDGMEEEEDYTLIIDEKKNIIERISKDPDEDETIYDCFNVKEKDGYSVYVNDELSGGEWVRYMEELESDEQSEYEYWFEDFCPRYAEEYGYSNIKYSNEGEDELNGDKTIKIKVTADQAYDSGVESAEEITRESVLDEYGWSEKEVALVDGFSEILDNYVVAQKESEGETTVKCALTVWVSVIDNTILKTRSAIKMDSAQDDSIKEALNTFEEESWKVDLIHESIADGMTEKEAKELLEEDIESMENPQEEDVVDGDLNSEEAGEEFDEEVGDDYAEITMVVVTKKIMTGENCPEMNELPKEYEEITQSEYFEGGMEIFEEDDYFPEDDSDEFADEFNM
ncbi:MAG: hypothetical protein ACI4D9_02205 [Lachnospiraceae bacterium]